MMRLMSQDRARKSFRRQWVLLQRERVGAARYLHLGRSADESRDNAKNRRDRASAV